MKRATEESLRKAALSKGAKLEFEGESLAPKPPPPPSISIDDVERLLTARDAVWRAELARVEAGNRANEWKFSTTYTSDGKIDEIAAVRIA